MKEDRRKIHRTSSCLALSQPRAACKLQATGEQLMSSPQPPFPGSCISITITAPEAAKRIQALKNKLEFNREINSVANCNAQRLGCVSVSSDSCTCSLGTVVISRPSAAFGHHFNIYTSISWGKSLQGIISAATYPKSWCVLCLLRFFEAMRCTGIKMLCDRN